MKPIQEITEEEFKAKLFARMKKDKDNFNLEDLTRDELADQLWGMHTKNQEAHDQYFAGLTKRFAAFSNKKNVVKNAGIVYALRGDFEHRTVYSYSMMSSEDDKEKALISKYSSYLQNDFKDVIVAWMIMDATLIMKIIPTCQDTKVSKRRKEWNGAFVINFLKDTQQQKDATTNLKKINLQDMNMQ